nr:hypothetical protein [uncultured Arsenicibacter sp.]
MNTHIGQRIKALAKMKGDTAETLAPILELTSSSVFKKFNLPAVSTEIVVKLSEYWNIPVSAFFASENEGVQMGGARSLRDKELKSENEKLKLELELKNQLLEEKERLINALSKR